MVDHTSKTLIYVSKTYVLHIYWILEAITQLGSPIYMPLCPEFSPQPPNTLSCLSPHWYKQELFESHNITRLSVFTYIKHIWVHSMTFGCVFSSHVSVNVCWSVHTAGVVCTITGGFLWEVLVFCWLNILPIPGRCVLRRGVLRDWAIVKLRFALWAKKSRFKVRQVLGTRHEELHHTYPFKPHSWGLQRALSLANKLFYVCKRRSDGLRLIHVNVIKFLRCG